MPVQQNRAAWLLLKNSRLSVRDASMPKPTAGEIVVRSRAVALNPFDGVVQTLGSVVTPWLTYPAVLGSDVAGEVVAVGPSVTRFRVGDRVFGLALGVDKVANRPAEGAFQLYVLLREAAAARIPDGLAYEQAAVLPLAVSTAACGLFLNEQLGLKLPAVPRAVPQGKTVLVWGGSTSVGSCAIQLAVAAGYDVVATASPGNFAYVRSLGAAQVFDYRAPDVTAQVVNALAGVELVGALALGTGSGSHCIDIVSRCRGRRFVAMASAPVPVDDAPLGAQWRWKLSRLPRLAAGFAAMMLKAKVRRVRLGSIWGTALVQEALGATIFTNFLEPALAQGQMVAAPAPLVAGHSLEEVGAAMSVLRNGVSAKKVVVLL